MILGEGTIGESVIGEFAGVSPLIVSAAGVLGLTGSATVAVLLSATAAGSIAFTGSASGAVLLSATAAGSISLTGAATGEVLLSATAAGLLDLGGAASGELLITAAAAGSISLTGAATGSVTNGDVFNHAPSLRTAFIIRRSRFIAISRESRLQHVVKPVRSVTVKELNMRINLPEKYTTEKIDYTVDWSEPLAADTISTSTWVVLTGDLTLVSNAHDISNATIWLEGGDAGWCSVKNTITTAGGRIMAQVFHINVLT